MAGHIAPSTSQIPQLSEQQYSSAAHVLLPQETPAGTHRHFFDDHTSPRTHISFCTHFLTASLVWSVPSDGVLELEHAARIKAPTAKKALRFMRRLLVRDCGPMHTSDFGIGKRSRSRVTMDLEIW